MSVPSVSFGGPLGEALAANLSGRLSRFVVDEKSPAIALFDDAHRRSNVEGDWYGEHAGKWLYAAAKAAARTEDAGLTARVHRVAAWLASRQEADGYLGTYAPARRFTHERPVRTRSWDGAPGARTWDVWTHAHLLLGLLEAHRHFPDSAVLGAARRIGDLCRRLFVQEGRDITAYGNHHGLSATVLLDPAVRLHLATGDTGYLELARVILAQAEARPELRLRSSLMEGVDASEIGTGKAYQVCWNLAGVARFARVAGDTPLLAAVIAAWDNVRAHHLTLGGGPWGGVGMRSREVFNPRGVFDPCGYVETCSTCAWIQWTGELLDATGEARFAEEIERSAYNDLLGAQAPGGEDWCYYSFPNGRRVHTTYWRCCKSSGATALEELPALAWQLRGAGDIAVNLYGAGRAEFAHAAAGAVTLEQHTRYPFEGAVRFSVEPRRPAEFALMLRIPAWAEGAAITINGSPAATRAAPSGYAVLRRRWSAGDVVALELPMKPVLHRRATLSVQESRTPDGAPVQQEVMRYDYAAVTRGPLVYATGLIDGFKAAESIRLPNDPTAEPLAPATTPAGFTGPALCLAPEGRAPFVLLPYYEAGGRMDGAWRLSWLPLAPVK
ncbi:MAG: glycoside hydrolase family 127 protein [Gammaproteobacteria bacterium]